MEDCLISRVMLLDDDNHEPSVVTMNGHYHSLLDFVNKVLIKPHSWRFEIKKISIIDFDLNDKYNGKDIDYLFDLLDLIDNPNELYRTKPELWQERKEAFDFFWNSKEAIKYA